MVGGSGYILAVSGVCKWIFFGWWWVLMGGGGYILAGGGWCWMVVAGDIV